LSLETFGTPGDLYLARGVDVNPNRPIFTGDVFDSVAIAGVQESGVAMVVAHPCSMRVGTSLQPSILMAAVKEHASAGSNAWTRGFFDLTPLPDLIASGLHVGSFEELGQARSAELDAAQRLACLSPLGVNLLQQRFIWYLTRLEVPTFRLQEAFGQYFEEVDLGGLDRQSSERRHRRVNGHRSLRRIHPSRTRRRSHAAERPSRSTAKSLCSTGLPG
jgi:hypothetical protein